MLNTPENGRKSIGAFQRDHRVEIFVQGFGKGIAPRYHRSIFDRYFRIPGTKVQGVVDQQGFWGSTDRGRGSVRAESAIRKGSRLLSGSRWKARGWNREEALHRKRKKMFEKKFSPNGKIGRGSRSFRTSSFCC